MQSRSSAPPFRRLSRLRFALMDWAEYVDDDTEADLVRWRRHLHESPELSFEEFETTEYVAGMLDQWGIPYDRPLPTGLVGHLHGKHPGPTVAFRCDLDGLPIDEQNGFDFRSRAPGKMHACGHDGHTAILLGLARTLNGLRDEVQGEVRLLFQPAEEVLESGARHMIDAGALEGVDAVIGLHLISNIKTGLISLVQGPILAAADVFEITVTGSGGHGGYPHETTDSLMIAAGLVGQLQTLVSRRVSPLEAAVVTVGTLHAGTAPNIIPGAANLTGTVRTLSEKLRVKIERELTGLVEHFARAHGGRPKGNTCTGARHSRTTAGLWSSPSRPRPRRSRATRWSTWRRRWAPKTSPTTRRWRPLHSPSSAPGTRSWSRTSRTTTRGSRSTSAHLESGCVSCSNRWSGRRGAHPAFQR